MADACRRPGKRHSSRWRDGALAAGAFQYFVASLAVLALYRCLELGTGSRCRGNLLSRLLPTATGRRLGRCGRDRWHHMLVHLLAHSVSDVQRVQRCQAPDPSADCAGFRCGVRQDPIAGASIIAHAIGNVPMTPFWQGVVVVALIIGTVMAARRGATVVIHVFSGATSTGASVSASSERHTRSRQHGSKGWFSSRL